MDREGDRVNRPGEEQAGYIDSDFERGKRVGFAEAKREALAVIGELSLALSLSIEVLKTLGGYETKEAERAIARAEAYEKEEG